MQPPIKLERVAQLRAEIDAGAKLEDLLEREQLTTEVWRASSAHHDQQLADEAAHGRFAITNRYRTAFEVKRKLLAAWQKNARPTLEPPTPAESPLAARTSAQPPPAPPMSVTPIERPPPPSTPPRFAPAAPPPRSALSPPPPPVMPGLGPPPPPAPTRAPPFPAAPPAAPRPPPASSSPTSAWTAPAPSAAVEHALAGTIAADAGTGAWAEAMPFLRAAREAKAAGLPPPPPPPAPPRATPVPESRSPGSDLSGTMAVHDDGFLASEVMPFLKAAREAMAAGLPIPFPGSVDEAPKGPPPRELSGTLGLDGSEQLAAALPFARAEVERRMAAAAKAAAPGAAAASSKTLSLEQFAAMTAEIAGAPAHASTVRHRWGFDEPSHRRESERWQAEFARTPALAGRYASLVRHYRDAKGRGP